MERMTVFTFEALKQRLPILEMTEVPATLGTEDVRYFSLEPLSVETVWRQEYPDDGPVPTTLIRMDGNEAGYPEQLNVTVRPLTTADVLVPASTGLSLVSRTVDGWLVTVYTGVAEVVAELQRQANDFAEKTVGSGSLQYRGASIGE